MAFSRLKPVVGITGHKDGGAGGLKIVSRNAHRLWSGDQDPSCSAAAKAVVRANEGRRVAEVVKGQQIPCFCQRKDV